MAKGKKSEKPKADKKLKKARRKARKILEEQKPLVAAAMAEEAPTSGTLAERETDSAKAPESEKKQGSDKPKGAEKGEDGQGQKSRPSGSRPLVTATSAVLSLVPEQGLSVVVLRSGESVPWRLPSAPLAAGEEPDTAVSRTVEEQTGVAPSAPVQLRVLADPEAADDDWVLTVAYLVTVLHHRVPGQPAPASGPGSRTRLPVAPEGVEVALAPIADLGAEKWGLPAAHRAVVDRAAAALRSEYRAAPDPHGFLHDDVTLSELRAVHEAVGGERLQPDTFRRAMVPRLAATGEKSGAGRGRPAALYSIER